MSHVLQISSGVGPVEVRRFVALLGDHLEALAETRGLVVEESVAHGAGKGAARADDAPRSISLQLGGDVPGLMADQLGTHELVHRSPERGRASRKRWFASVTLHPTTPLSSGLRLPSRDELEISATRAGGPGGQHVNKVATAVRVHHLPSGLVVRSAGARSQKANLDQALHRIASLLAEREAQAAARAEGARRIAHYRVERGRPICSYSLGDRGLERSQ